MSIFLSVCLSVCLFDCLSVCLWFGREAEARFGVRGGKRCFGGGVTRAVARTRDGVMDKCMYVQSPRGGEGEIKACATLGARDCGDCSWRKVSMYKQTLLLGGRGGSGGSAIAVVQVRGEGCVSHWEVLR